MVFKSKFSFKCPDVSLYQFMFECKREFPQDKPAYVNAEDKSQFITFGDLKNLTLRFGAGLQRLPDFKRGNVVALYSPSNIYYVPVLHGTVTVGGILSAIDHTCDVNTAVQCMQLVDAKYIVAHPDTLERSIEAAKITGIPLHRIFVLGKSDIHGVACVESKFWGSHKELAIPIKYSKEELDTTVCYYYFTSGTTGHRKAVTITQRTMLHTIASKGAFFPSHSNLLVHTGLHHISSLTVVMHRCATYGYTTYILEEYSFEKLLLAIQECRITGFVTQPWIATSLAKEPIVDKYDISSLEWVIAAGSTVDKEMCATFLKRLGFPCISFYGMTELLTSFDASLPYTLAGQVGTLCADCSCKLIDENGKEVGYNEVGELIIKGPAITPGYHNNPEATAQAFDKEGFYHTGDLFKVDENEVFTYVDRVKDVIQYKFHYIAPQDIENVLMSHSLVTDCAAVGIFSEKEKCWVPTGFVMLANNSNDLEKVKNEILVITKAQLTAEKQLHDRLFILNDLPRNSTGKINRRELRNLFTIT